MQPAASINSISRSGCGTLTRFLTVYINSRQLDHHAGTLHRHQDTRLARGSRSSGGIQPDCQAHGRFSKTLAQLRLGVRKFRPSPVPSPIRGNAEPPQQQEYLRGRGCCEVSYVRRYSEAPKALDVVFSQFAANRGNLIKPTQQTLHMGKFRYVLGWDIGHASYAS